MTLDEKIIVSAYTDVLMCPFSLVHEEIENRMERPVLTHELLDDETHEKIKSLFYDDFIRICNDDF